MNVETERIDRDSAEDFGFGVVQFRDRRFPSKVIARIKGLAKVLRIGARRIGLGS
jgi:hypothetical protein